MLPTTAPFARSYFHHAAMHPCSPGTTQLSRSSALRRPTVAATLKRAEWQRRRAARRASSAPLASCVRGPRSPPPSKGGMATETRGAPSIIRSASLVCTRPTVTATLKGRNGKRRRAARTACSQTQPLRCQANSHHRRCRREASRRRVTNTRTACLRARCARASCRRV